jgi:hypothetical protein
MFRVHRLILSVYCVHRYQQIRDPQWDMRYYLSARDVHVRHRQAMSALPSRLRILLFKWPMSVMFAWISGSKSFVRALRQHVSFLDLLASQHVFVPILLCQLHLMHRSRRNPMSLMYRWLHSKRRIVRIRALSSSTRSGRLFAG